MSTHPLRTIIITVLVVAACSAALLWAYSAGLIGNPYVRAEDLRRVLIVAASPDEEGSSVGQIIVIADLSGAEPAMEPVSPALPVTIPGTSYKTLGDAYPFGGGAGTARALAKAQGGAILPYVAISPEQLAEVVQAAGGVRVELPAPVNVFDGDKLYAFKSGEQTLDSAQLEALLKGAPYLTASQRKALDSSLAQALTSALAHSPEVVNASDTNLAPEALSRLEAALQAL